MVALSIQIIQIKLCQYQLRPISPSLVLDKLLAIIHYGFTMAKKWLFYCSNFFADCNTWLCSLRRKQLQEERENKGGINYLWTTPCSITNLQQQLKRLNGFLVFIHLTVDWGPLPKVGGVCGIKIDCCSKILQNFFKHGGLHEYNTCM